MRHALLITLLLIVAPVYAIDWDEDGVEDSADPNPNNPKITGYKPPQLHTIIGSTGQQLGVSTSGIGDINKDGHDDIIIGSKKEESPGYWAGSAQVFSGKDYGVLYTFSGSHLNDNFGTVNGAGDINNDGYPDFIIGAARDDTNGYRAGSARVFSGADGALLHIFYGDSDGDEFGFAVSGAGDVNNDGYDDLIVGARLDGTNGFQSGSAYIFSGANGQMLYQFYGNPTENFGFSVSGAGDVNKDSYADVIVGASYGKNSQNLFAGTVKVFSGFNGSTLFTFDSLDSFTSPQGDLMGVSVSGGGDIDNDGYADLIIGDPDASIGGITKAVGIVRVYSGRSGSILHSIKGSTDGFNLGTTVRNAGDIDGDSRPDFIAGSGAAAGIARVYSGTTGNILFAFYGDSIQSDHFGMEVSGAGDVNGDGHADLVVTAYGDDNNNGVDAGSVHIYSGAMYLQQFTDTDGDGKVDTKDADDDGDGIPDNSDAFPQDTNNDGIPNAMDIDNDGITNQTDTDDDNDGIPDTIDSNPLVPLSVNGTYRGSSLRENTSAL